MKVVITGFGPFPGMTENPTGALLDSLDTRAGILARHDVRRAVLETSYAFCADWVDRCLVTEVVDVALHLGVAKGADRCRVEAVAHNRVGASPLDARGETWPQPEVIPGGPETLEAAVPVVDVFRHLVALDLPVELSRDAGRYVCNFLYYRSLAAASRAQPLTRTVFLHVPAAPSTTQRAPTAIVRALLEFVLTR